MDSWVDYYIRGMGFEQLVTFDDKDISTEYSSLRSKVVQYNDRITDVKMIKKTPIFQRIEGFRADTITDFINSGNMVFLALGPFSPSSEYLIMYNGSSKIKAVTLPWLWLWGY